MVEISASGESRISGRYAAALYALAYEQGVLDQVVAEMAGLGRLIVESPELSRLVGSPFADSQSRVVLAKALAAQGFLPMVLNFVNVVVANRRLHDLSELIAGFAAYVAAKRGEVVARVTTVDGLTDLQRTQLRARLTEAGFGNVRLIESTDPTLLGGMVLKIGTRLYDTSLKSRLERLNYSLKGAA